VPTGEDRGFTPVAGKKEDYKLSSRRKSMQEGSPSSDAQENSSQKPAAEMLITRHQAALQAAELLFAQDPDWLSFFREILGVAGIVRRLFPKPELLAEFEHSEEFAQIQMMLAQLRVKKVPAEKEEPVKMITVRLPASLHKALQAEAYDRQTSVNKLCITKLLRVIDDHKSPESEPTKAKNAKAKNAKARRKGSKRSPPFSERERER
jgi:predicted HicB family RNase H-like nuclease